MFSNCPCGMSCYEGVGRPKSLKVWKFSIDSPFYSNPPSLPPPIYLSKVNGQVVWSCISQQQYWSLDLFFRCFFQSPVWSQDIYLKVSFSCAINTQLPSVNGEVQNVKSGSLPPKGHIIINYVLKRTQIMRHIVFLPDNKLRSLKFDSLWQNKHQSTVLLILLGTIR